MASGTLSRGAFLLLAATWLTTAAAAPDHSRASPQKHAFSGQPVWFAVISDPHLYNARLGTSGAAFKAYLAQDPKLLRDSEAILDSALESVVQQRVDFLIISGDLTKDGELRDHVLMAQHLQKLRRQGIQVFVVPGNHDINNPDAMAFVGATNRPVPNITPRLFQAIYHRFGYGQAIMQDKNSLSYVVEPVLGLWLLGIDSCKYQDNLELGYPEVSGRISPETMAWIQGVMQQAQTCSKKVIAFMHHGVNQHFFGEAQLFPDYLVDDRTTTSIQLASTGLKVVFTGHYHSQDAAYLVDENLTPLSPLCDVETGSLVQYPCAFRVVTIGTNDTLRIQSQRVTEIQGDTGNVPFQDYAYNFLATRLLNIVTSQLMILFQLPHDQAAQVSPLVAEALIANYAGDEVPSQQTQTIIGGLIGSPEPMHTLGTMLLGLWTDLPPHDNQLQLTLD